MKKILLTCLILFSCSGSGPSGDAEITGGLWGKWGNGDRVVILHQGHDTFDGKNFPEINMVPIAERLAALGYTVYGFEMPALPHDPPIDRFYRPVLDLIDQLPEGVPVFMMGISGGGWTTTVVTALSPRIIRGYSVAGDLPLDLRAPREQGDWEQQNPPYPYRDMYDMAAGRIMHIFNQYDPCCFAYTGTETELETPFMVDTTHNQHMISEWAILWIIADMGKY